MSEPLEHTPGPWVADIRGGCLAVYPKARADDTPGVHDFDARNIHYSNRGAEYVIDHWEMDEQAKADARLIAAAPDLLAERDKLLALLREARRVMGNAALDDWTCQNDPDLEKDWNNLLSCLAATLEEKR